jgi:hypothetical protein
VSIFSEYRKLGNSVLSLSAAIDDAIYLKYFLGDDNTDVVDFTIKDITRNIPLLLGGIREEVQCFWQEFFSPADSSNWFQRPAQPTILTGIGRIATRILVGKKYSSNLLFTSTASKFADGISFQGIAFHFVPKAVLPWLCKVWPTMRRVKLLKGMLRDDVYAYIQEPADIKDKITAKGEELIILRYLVKYVQAKPAY